MEKKNSITSVLKEIGFFERLKNTSIFVGKFLGTILFFGMLILGYTNICKIFFNKESSLIEGISVSIIAMILMCLLMTLFSISFMDVIEYSTNEQVNKIKNTLNTKTKILLIFLSIITTLIISYILGFLIIAKKGVSTNIFVTTFLGLNVFVFSFMILSCALLLVFIIIKYTIAFTISKIINYFQVVNALTYMPIEIEDIKKLNIDNYIDFERYILNLFKAHKSIAKLPYELKEKVRQTIETSLRNYGKCYDLKKDKYLNMMVLKEFESNKSKNAFICDFINNRSLEISKSCNRYITIKDLDLSIKDTLKYCNKNIVFKKNLENN